MLAQLRAVPDIEIVGLLTTINEEADRVAIHAVRRSLLLRQAAAAGLPIRIVGLPWPCTNEQYEARMEVALREVSESGVTHIAFGDLLLEDVRAYRERQLAGTGLEPLFPLWHPAGGTAALAQSMLDAGIRAVLTCVDPSVLPERFLGREFDAGLLADLPRGVDPCGERGEFHTFCYAGPMLAAPIAVRPGDRVTRDEFAFLDLVPESD